MGTLADDVLQTLAEAGEGLKALQEEVIEARFDPDDPASVQAAICFQRPPCPHPRGCVFGRERQDEDRPGG
ncbi:hypothetical protein AX768_31070 (plasmid) [Burkholderia sp. PAMC 28687]|nr:hypothetical protein AX768_31070 [Burkholderia sp. PAMC 28687]